MTVSRRYHCKPTIVHLIGYSRRVTETCAVVRLPQRLESQQVTNAFRSTTRSRKNGIATLAQVTIAGSPECVKQKKARPNRLVHWEASVKFPIVGDSALERMRYAELSPPR